MLITEFTPPPLGLRLQTYSNWNADLLYSFFKVSSQNSLTFKDYGSSLAQHYGFQQLSTLSFPLLSPQHGSHKEYIQFFLTHSPTKSINYKIHNCRIRLQRRKNKILKSRIFNHLRLKNGKVSKLPKDFPTMPLILSTYN